MAANLKDMTLTPTGAIKGNEMISDLEDTALDQERILPSSCFASPTVSLSGCLATEIKMRIRALYICGNRHLLVTFLFHAIPY